MLSLFSLMLCNNLATWNCRRQKIQSATWLSEVIVSLSPFCPLDCWMDISWFVVKVSAFLEVNDIAGLVRGAHAGQGLGNNFLSHIRAVDGIFHVLSKFAYLWWASSMDCMYQCLQILCLGTMRMKHLLWFEVPGSGSETVSKVCP